MHPDTDDLGESIYFYPSLLDTKQQTEKYFFEPVYTQTTKKPPIKGGLKLILAITYFPKALRLSIVGPDGLNFRVRNGNGWTPTGNVTRKSISYFQSSILIHPSTSL